MATSVLSSPFMNLNTINTILSSTKTIPIEQKIQLLEAKIHLLTSTLPALVSHAIAGDPAPIHSLQVRSARDTRVQEIDTIRLDLGQTYLQQKVPDYIRAEVEFGIIDKDCKNMLKRLKKRANSDSTKQAGIADPFNIHQPESPISEEEWIVEIKRLRISALKGMIIVEEGLGRAARVERWKKAIEDIEHSPIP
ncbi:uncharacterized protein I303_105336 [Kwoniella dejecticola CBS 10117]|uniref:Uncharacterized protein n=1 Tax=Kwoniella dejecticola CBS 10117 TaxID=1296121 RepID=A0A1A6A2T0_9TREE|nr:uncharacterized protein I303_05217 [Kwoniella dejecticola CBS 10117]OBR84359.1 hypothetical protein I303_05217 [Kwoniella dejecticola CBS 10117]